MEADDDEEEEVQAGVEKSLEEVLEVGCSLVVSSLYPQ